MKKRHIPEILSLFFCVAVLFATSISSCTGSRPALPGGNSLKGKKIGFILKTFANPFFSEIERGARDEAAKYDFTVFAHDPERDEDRVEEQMELIKTFIENKVDVLCITPLDINEVLEPILQANRAGIPVIILDTELDWEKARKKGAKTLCYIGSNNYRGGMLAGEFLAEKIGKKGEVAVITGWAIGTEPGETRKNGFIKSISNYPDIKFVGVYDGKALRAGGMEATREILKKHPDLRGIFAINDRMSQGALDEIILEKKEGKVEVVGFDAAEEAKARIKDGKMAGSIAQYPREMGKMAIEAAVKALQKKPVPPFIYTKVEIITREKLLSPFES